MTKFAIAHMSRFTIVYTILTSLALYILPESPIWILGSYNDLQKLFWAEKSLQQLRYDKSNNATLSEIYRLIGEKDLSHTIKLLHPWFYKPLLICIFLSILMQCSIFNPFNMYGQSVPLLMIYTHSYINHTIFNRTLASIPFDNQFFCTIGIIQIVASGLVMILLVRRFDRRYILLINCKYPLLFSFLKIILHRSSLKKVLFKNKQFLFCFN